MANFQKGMGILKLTLDILVKTASFLPKFLRNIVDNWFISELDKKLGLEILRRRFSSKKLNFNAREGLYRFVHNSIEWSAREDHLEPLGLSIPYAVLVSPSMRCNLRCEGCYAANYNKDRDMKTETLDRIFSDAAKLNIPLITILGGEPFIIANKLLPLLKKYKNKLFFQIFAK